MNAAHAQLLLAVGLLALGPVLSMLLERRASWHALLDGFVLTLVSGLCALFLLPHAWETLGAWALPLAAVGLLLPHLTHAAFARRGHDDARGIFALAFLGLLLHAALDGVAFAYGDAGHGTHGTHDRGAHGSLNLPLVLAVLGHRLPVGLLIGSLHTSLGLRKTWAAILALSLATVSGFALAHPLEALADSSFPSVVEALLAGGLLHVVLDHAPPTSSSSPRWGALGAGLGVALLAAIPTEAPPVLFDAARAAWHMTLESSPAILLGFFGAGLLSLVPQHRLRSLMTGGGPLRSALRGVVFGLPIPLCSCGVVPVYRGLLRHRVPVAAAMAFLVATPELGIDSLALSWTLLGPEVTLLRLAAAALVALTAGALAARLVDDPAPTDPAPADDPQTSLRDAARYGLITSVDELGPWILAGLAVAGLVEPLADPQWFATLPDALEVPVAAVSAAPVYVCAAALTPAAAVLLAKGLSAGAVIAFLLAGPATNVTTYGALQATHGRRRALQLLAVIILGVIGAGLLIDLLLPAVPLPPTSGEAHAHGELGYVSVAVFGVLLLFSLLRQGPRGFLAHLGLGHDHDHDHASDSCCASEESPQTSGTCCG